MKTRLNAFDWNIKLEPGKFVTVAARPKMGVTNLFCTIAANIVASRQQVELYYFSSDTSSEDLLVKIPQKLARVDLNRMTKDSWLHLARTVGDYPSRWLKVCEYKHAHKVEEIITAMKSTPNRKLVFIDKLTSLLETSSDPIVNAQIYRRLKYEALQNQASIFASVNVNSEVEKTVNKRPLSHMILDYADGALESISDYLFILYRDEVYNRWSTEELGVAELILAKSELGPKETNRLAFISDYGLFANLSNESEGKHDPRI